MDNDLIIDNYFDSKEFLTPIQNSLISTLKKGGPMTRRELVKQLNTPRTTIYDNLLKLQKNKLVEKYARNNGKRGRPLVFWKSL
ncbi:MAG: hypothetical protein EU535_03275 [Promethearchaeota archaeon]|nr:MAG: hypothetical protein EU535_03275 [Candidatus Lokiarchaeota archaeon]